MPTSQPPTTQFKAARDCAYRNHLFFKTLLDVLRAGGEAGTAPEHLASAAEAGEEYAAANEGRVTAQDVDKTR